MLQWCREPGRLFQDLAAIIKPGGVFVFSSLGPDTLRELRECWAAVDDLAHVNIFLDMHELGDAMVKAGFTDPVMEADHVTLSYADVFRLLNDLKALGVQNVNMDRRRTMTGKQRFMRMRDEYEKRRAGGKLPATYEVIYGHAWAPPARTEKPAGPRVAVFPVETLKRALRKRS
jgi:malonyl-CoA O-methyltransferase